jgi:hypothetical protein
MGCMARVEDTALRAAKAFAEMDAVDFRRAVARTEDQGQEAQEDPGRTLTVNLTAISRENKATFNSTLNSTFFVAR